MSLNDCEVILEPFQGQVNIQSTLRLLVILLRLLVNCINTETTRKLRILAVFETYVLYIEITRKRIEDTRK